MLHQKRALTRAQVEEAGFQRGEYSDDLPEGTWRGRLDFKKWGRRCLLCYFTELTTGRQYRIAAFREDDKRYTPRDGSVDFSYTDPGAIFELTTGKNTKGRSAWLGAEEVAA